MKRLTIITAFALITLIFVAFTGAHGSEEAHNDEAHNAGTPKTTNNAGLNLSPEVKALLIEEMRALYGGITKLTSALITGEWEEVATVAKKIEGSYIMKRSLTDDQKAELKSKLPPLLIEYDKAFHGYAGMLAHAAENKNADVANFYLSKLTETCIQCHSRFAGERFPGLVRGSSPSH